MTTGYWVVNAMREREAGGVEWGYRVFDAASQSYPCPWRATVKLAQRDYHDMTTHTHSRTTCPADVEGPTVMCNATIDEFAHGSDRAVRIQLAEALGLDPSDYVL